MKVEVDLRIVFDMPDPKVDRGSAISRPMDAARDELEAISRRIVEGEHERMTNTIRIVEPKRITIEP